MYSILYVSETKSQVETVSYFGDFRDVLAVGETITSQSVSVVVISGNDSNPSNMLYGGIAIHNGTIIEQRIRLGVIGCIYDISFTVGTSLGNEFIKFTRLAILPNNWNVNPQLTVYELTSWNYPYNATESIQGYFNWTGGNNFWLQPYFQEKLQGSISILSGNLSGGSITYSYKESIQGGTTIVSGTLTLVVIAYSMQPETIKGGVTIISGNLSQGAVSYTTVPETIQGNITITSGSLI